MLRIAIPISPEGWDEQKKEFVDPETVTVELEHSLVSLSKWESKWNKPFYSKIEKTTEETMDYVQCMVLTPNIDPSVFNYLTQENITEINNYIEAPMTATTFSKDQTGKNNREIITSELIYYWMISLNIPVEFQYWHLNRLLTLIRVCNVKNTPPKKMSHREIMSRNAALNASRKQQMNSKG